jgi:hypothetical protein
MDTCFGCKHLKNEELEGGTMSIWVCGIVRRSTGARGCLGGYRFICRVPLRMRKDCWTGIY